MPDTKTYNHLHDKVMARPGAAERLAALREQTLAEIELYELRNATERSQTELAATLGISQSAVSQLERSDDIRISTLRRYLTGIGGTLRLIAVFTDEDGSDTLVPIQIGTSRADPEPATGHVDTLPAADSQP